MAIRTNFQLSVLEFDVNAYERLLRDEMTEEIKEAAKDWLATVISIVPVWSRASHATFKPLADAVGFTIPTSPLAASAPEDRSALGESVSVGKLELENNKFFFVYETNLQYLAFNEFNVAEFPNAGIFSPQGLKTPTPFNFTKIAGEEFAQRAVNIPNPIEFMLAKRI